MSWDKLTVDEKRAIARRYNTGDPLDELAAQFGIKTVSLERYARNFLYYEKILLTETSQKINIPSSPSRQWLDYETITADNCLIISDLEIPDHDEKFLRAALLLALRHNIKTLIVAGDLVSTDQPGLSSHDGMMPADMAHSYNGTLEIAKSMLWSGFGEWMTTITCIEGNHDDMVTRKTGGEIHLGMFISSEHVRYSRYSYLWLKTSAGYVYICHPRQYRRNSGSLGQDFYNIILAPDQSKPHVVIAHTHHPQMVQSPDGLRWVCALGTMRDHLRTTYKATRSTTHHQWGNAFLMIKDGYPYLMHKQFTDWRYWLADLYDPGLFGGN